MMNSRTAVIRHSLLFAALVAFFCGGCGKQQAKTGATGATGVDVPASVAAYGESPTEGECLAFSKSLEEAVRSQDVAAINALIDWDAILERATAGIDIPAKPRNEFIRGVKNRVTGSNGLGGQLAGEAAKGGTYRLLRVRDENEQKRTLFRLLTEQHGVNYHDLLLVRKVDGKVLAADIYVFISAEFLSQSIRRGFVPVAAEVSKSVLAKLTQSEGDFIKHAGKVEEMSNAIRDGRGQQALEIYEQFPDSLKADKNVLLMRLMAASTLDEQVYDDAIQAFQTFHPDDKCLDLITLDSCLIHKKFGRARAAIDRLDKSLGGDPYLNVLRANSYLEENRCKEARDYARKAEQAEKDLLPAYWTQIAVALKQKEFDEVKRLLTQLEEEFSVEIADLTTLPDYAEFVKSPQYQDWLKRKRSHETDLDRVGRKPE